MVARAKVILNIHGEEGSTLEVHRVNHLLSMGKCVVSERSMVDPTLDRLYGELNSIIFAESLDAIYEVARVLLELTSLRILVEQQALDFYHRIQSNVSNLQLAIQFAFDRLDEEEGGGSPKDTGWL